MLQVESSRLHTYLGAPWCLGRFADFIPIERDGERFAHKIKLLGHTYVIWTQGNQIFALDNICPHAGASLGDGGYLTTRTFEVANQSDSLTRECLACPYHGHQVQFLPSGRAIIDDQATPKPLQASLELIIKDGLVWTYGLEWSKENGQQVARKIKPKLPIPDYSQVLTGEDLSSVDWNSLSFVSQQERSVETNILHFILNVHDAQHFAEVHKQTMLTAKVNVSNLTQEENVLRWQLGLNKRQDSAAKKSPYKTMIKDSDNGTYFNTYLPGFAITAYEFAPGQMIYDVISLYPESKTSTHLKLTNFRNFELKLPWYAKLLGARQIINQFRLDLVSEDVRNLENISDDYTRKINLAHDEPVIEAMKYLDNWPTS